MGDEVIRNVAKRLMEGLRDEDSVCRVGGEEYMLILPNCNPDYVSATLERMRHSVESRPLTNPALAWPVTMSFGAASLVPNMETPPALLIKRADEALYRAKDAGRNRVEIEN